MIFLGSITTMKPANSWSFGLVKSSEALSGLLHYKSSAFVIAFNIVSLLIPIPFVVSSTSPRETFSPAPAEIVADVAFVVAGFAAKCPHTLLSPGHGPHKFFGLWRWHCGASPVAQDQFLNRTVCVLFDLQDTFVIWCFIQEPQHFVTKSRFVANTEGTNVFALGALVVHVCFPLFGCRSDDPHESGVVACASLSTIH